MLGNINPEDHLQLITVALNKLNIPERYRRDFYQIGYIGLDRAIKTYKIERGSFSTWAVICIKSEILRNPTINDVIPKQDRSAWKAINLVKDVEYIQQQRLNNDLDRLSDVELADLLGWDLEEFRRYMSYVPPTILFDTSYITRNYYQSGCPLSALGDSLYYHNRIASKLVTEPEQESLALEGEILTILNDLEERYGDDVTAYIMHTVNNYTYKEISNKMNCALSTVEWKAARGKQIVTSALREYYIDVMGHEPLSNIIKDLLDWAEEDNRVKEFILAIYRKDDTLTAIAQEGEILVRNKYSNVYREIVDMMRADRKKLCILGEKL